MPVIYNVSIEPTEIENRFRIDWQNAVGSGASFEQTIDITPEEKQWLWQMPRHRQIIGEKLFVFLDGPDRHFQQALEHADRENETLLVNLHPCKATDDLPFEVLAKDGTFLLPKDLHLVRCVSALREAETVLPGNRPLKLLFMACSVKDVQPESDFEKEEEAIFQITDKLPIDMEVEDSGTLEGLRGKLEQEEYDVVHLSGHAGIDKNGNPYFVMEDDSGGEHRVFPDRLWSEALIKNPPRLMVLSGSRTAETPGLSNMPLNEAESSLARLLVEKYNVPAVLGWGRKVNDEQAILAGKMLFLELSKGRSIVEAVQRARYELTIKFPHSDKPAWPLLRLYASAIPLDAPVRKEQQWFPKPRRMTHIYLKNSRVKILQEGFVGRRRQLQESLRGLNTDVDKVGVLIMGTGGLGKSCLAGKICERFRDHTLIIIQGRLNTLSLEAGLRDAFIISQDEKGKSILAQGIEMKDKLAHLCTTGFKERNYLFLLDDFEQNLEGFEEGKPGVLLPEAAALLGVLLHYLSFSGKLTQVVITSRYEFSLQHREYDIIEKRLKKIWLTGFNKTEQRKKFPGLKHIFTFEDREVGRQLLTAGQGNPRLMEWIDLLVMQLKVKEAEALAAAVADKQEEFIKKHVIRELLKKGGASLGRFLRWFCIYRIPVLEEGVSLVAKKARVKDCKKLLHKGMALSLVEYDQTWESYQVTPLLRQELLKGLRNHLPGHQAAFAYFKKICKDRESVEPVLIEEWIFHALGCGKEDFAFKQGGNFVRQLREHLAFRESLRVGEWLLAVKKHSLSTNDEGILINEIALTMHEVGNSGKAIDYLQRTLIIMKKIHGEKHTLIATTMNNLGEVWKALDAPDKAIDSFQQALEIWEKVYGEEHPNVAVVMNNLGLTYGMLSEHRKAVNYFRQAIDIWKKVYGEKHPQVGISLNNLGGAFNDLGESHTAIEYYRQALAIDEAIFGNEHPNVALELNNLGAAYLKLGDSQKSIDYFLQSLSVYVKVFGREHPDVARGLNNIGEVMRALGDPRKGIDLFLQAVDTWKKVYGETHHQVAVGMNNLGSAWDDLADHRKAIYYYQQALAIDERVYGKKDPNVARVLNNLGSAWHNLGDYQKAIDYFQQAIIIWEKASGDQSSSVAAAMNNLGSAWQELGDAAKAIEYYQQAYIIHEKVIGPDNSNAALELNNLGSAWYDLGDYRKAANCFERALDISKKIHGEKHPQIAVAMSNLGALYVEFGEYEKAKGYLEKSYTFFSDSLGSKHPHTLTAKDWLDRCPKMQKQKNE